MRYLIVFILFSFGSFAQTVSLDTIVLKEVIIQKNNKTEIKYVSPGKGTVRSGFGADFQIVSLLDNIPSGQLQCVTFYFNDRSIFDAMMQMEYKTADFELLLFTVKDNQPDKKLLEEELLFTVKDFDKGKIILDVSALEISNEKQLFVGFRKLEKTEKSNFNIIFKKDPKGITMVRTSEMKSWSEFPSITDRPDEKGTLKIDLTLK